MAFPEPAPAAPPPAAQPQPEAQPKAEAEDQTEVSLELTEKDFIAGKSNRDPFESFLDQFTKTKRVDVEPQVNVILPRYALDELSLIAVITGGIRPKAMFRDPTGLGVTVKRGDYISKSKGKIRRILSDKVIIEIKEQHEDTESKADRVIELHPKDGRGINSED